MASDKVMLEVEIVGEITVTIESRNIEAALKVLRGIRAHKIRSVIRKDYDPSACD